MRFDNQAIRLIFCQFVSSVLIVIRDAYRCVGRGVVEGLGSDGGSCGGRRRGAVSVILVVGHATRRPHDVLEARVHL